MKNVLFCDLLNNYFNLLHYREASPEWRYLNDLKNLMRDWSFNKVVLCCDTGQSQYRLGMYPQYKEKRRARREAAPPEEKEKLSKFFEQVNRFKALAPTFGFEVVAIPGVEADDILAYFALNAGTDYRAALLSSDTDLFQLLKPGVMQRAYSDKMKLLDVSLPQQVWVDKPRFEEAYGISPEQYLECKALSGDTGDSIYSTAGMGETTALKLIRKYESLDNIEANLETLDVPRFTASARKELIANFHIPRRNVKLVSLLHDEETLRTIFKDSLPMLDEVRDRLTERPDLDEDAIKEYLFTNGKVAIYEDFNNWVRPLRGYDAVR